jgi:hypothetical protein
VNKEVYMTMADQETVNREGDVTAADTLFTGSLIIIGMYRVE